MRRRAKDVLLWSGVVVLVVAVFIGVQVAVAQIAAVTSELGRGPNSGADDSRTRPPANPVSSYLVEIAIGADEFEPVTTGADGEGCQRLGGDADARRTCVLATNLIPSVIAGEAFGELNLGRSPVYDAIVWRARANGDVMFCDEAGLLGDLLARCRTDAVIDAYLYVAGEIRVRVPRGSGPPSPAP